MARRPKQITPELREQILSLHTQGQPNHSIADQLGLKPKQVAAVVSTAQNSGRLPKPPGPTRGTPTAPPSVTPSSSAPPSNPGANSGNGSDEGHTWTPMTPGMGGPYAPAGYSIYYQVERLEPSHEGVLRKYNTSPSDDEIGKTYGSGFYRVTRHEGARITYREVRISSSYGPPRNPRGNDGPQRMPYSSGRFLDRIRGAREEDDAHSGPSYPRRPYFPERPYRDREEERSPADDLAQGSVAVAAVQQLGKLQELTLKRQDAESKTGPQAFMTSLFEKQQSRDEQRNQEERTRREEERKEEERRWERRQRDQEEQHKRELSRLEKEAELRAKSERERLTDIMALYDKRMQIAETETQNRESRLKEDLERSRQEAKEDREKLLEKLSAMTQESEERIKDMSESLSEEMKKERENLSKHHELKMKALENEHALRQEMLKLREDMIKSQGNDGIEKTITNIAQGLERTIREAIDLKKIEAVSGLSPEAQAAHVVKESEGLPQETKAETAPAKAPSRETPAQTPPVQSSSMSGNGHQKTTIQKQEQDMENQVRQHINEPLAQDLLKEWGRNLDKGADGIAFANMFMEWMKDEANATARQTCSAIVTFVNTRTWSEVLEVIRPGIPANLIPQFELPHGEAFYKVFKAIVVGQVHDYYVSYLQAKEVEQKERAAALQSAQPEPQRASA